MRTIILSGELARGAENAAGSRRRKCGIFVGGFDDTSQSSFRDGSSQPIVFYGVVRIQYQIHSTTRKRSSMRATIIGSCNDCCRKILTCASRQRHYGSWSLQPSVFAIRNKNGSASDGRQRTEMTALFSMTRNGKNLNFN